MKPVYSSLGWGAGDRGGQLRHSETPIVKELGTGTSEINILWKINWSSSRSYHNFPLLPFTQETVMTAGKHAFSHSCSPGILFGCIYFTAFSSLGLSRTFG